MNMPGRSIIIAAGLAATLCVPVAVSRAIERAALVDSGVNGSWKGGLLPPGITGFEAIQSSVTFRPDGNFTVTVEKPTGTFKRQGSYSLKDGVLALTYAFGSSAPARYRLTRTGKSLGLQPLDTPDAGALTLQPTPASAPSSG
jgi:hypothetical protein